MKTKDLFDEAASLPVEERAVLADFLLKTLTPTDAGIFSPFGIGNFTESASLSRA